MEDPSFQVFVEGPTEPAHLDAMVTRLATTYGLPEASLRTRLQLGPVRVKSNVNQATAEAFVRELGKLGAKASAQPMMPKPRGSASTMAAQAAPTLPSAAPAAGAPQRAPSNPAYQSGLAAAFVPSASAITDLGALSGDSLTLAAIDGSEGTAPKPPLPRNIPIGKNNTSEYVKNANVERPDAPDAFAPPDASTFGPGEHNPLLDLAPDLEPRPEKIMRKLEPALPPPPAPVVEAPREPIWRKVLEHERARFSLGVLVAIGVAALPAMAVGNMRERSGFDEVHRELGRRHTQATTQEAWDALDGARASLLIRKQSERSQAAAFAFLVWMLAGGGLVFVWHRHIPWDDWLERPRLG